MESPGPMTEKPDLAALVGSRICHDLISPLGAIGNGVELLSIRAASMGPELALISESVTSANARLRFYRIAFGAASEIQRIGRPEILGILADLTQGGRLTVDWQAAGDATRADVKLAFLLIQCLETALPYGGRITVAAGEAGWRLTGQAARMKLDAPLWAALTSEGQPAEIGPAQVQFLLAPAEARARGLSLSCALGEEEIRLGF